MVEGLLVTHQSAGLALEGGVGLGVEVDLPLAGDGVWQPGGLVDYAAKVALACPVSPTKTWRDAVWVLEAARDRADELLARPLIDERFFQSAKYEHLYRHEIDDGQALAEHIDRYLVVYNEVRPHEALDYARPLPAPVDHRTSRPADRPLL